MDRDNDTLYYRLTDAAIFESEEVQPGVILDFDEDGRVVGVEMLALSTRIEPESSACCSSRQHSCAYPEKPQ